MNGRDSHLPVGRDYWPGGERRAGETYEMGRAAMPPQGWPLAAPGSVTRLPPGAMLDYARRRVNKLRFQQQSLYDDMLRLQQFQRYLRQRRVPDGDYPLGEVEEFLSLVRTRLGEEQHRLYARAIHRFMLDQVGLPAALPPGEAVPRRQPLWGRRLVRAVGLAVLALSLCFVSGFPAAGPLLGSEVKLQVRGAITVPPDPPASSVSTGAPVAGVPGSRLPVEVLSPSGGHLGRLATGPEPSGPTPVIQDLGQILGPAQWSRLQVFCRRLFMATGMRPVVITVKHSGLHRPQELARRIMLAQGSARTVLLLVVTSQRAVHLRVGKSLAPRISQAVCGRVLDRELIPRFKRKLYVEGIEATFRALALRAGFGQAMAAIMSGSL